MECPTEDVLAALVERELAEDSHAEVTAHVDTCDLCQQVLIATVRGSLAVGTEAATPRARISRPSLRGPALGERVGRFELRRLLGAGGMGQVFEAFDPQLDRAIALKVMRAELVGREMFAERLLRESRMMAKLAHPSVITVYDVGREDNVVFIAMELVRGETLGEYVRRAHPPWREVIACLARAGEGLSAAHAAGIVHRDFKPDNVLVELAASGVKRVVVTDFGIARAAGSTDTPVATSSETSIELTSPGAAIGTPAYMPPEQLAGEPVDTRADVFAFAVTAWELLFGERPFRGTTARELRDAIATPPRVPATSSVPRRLSSALVRALAAAPADRGSLDDVLAELARVTAPRRWWIAAAAMGAIGAATVALAITRTPQAPQSPCEQIAQSFATEVVAHHYDLVAALGRQPDVHASAMKRIATASNSWLVTHDATCRGTQSPKIATCLAQRRQELAGTVEELLLDSANSDYLVAFIGDPLRCNVDGGEPASGLLSARVPADPAQRHRVTDLRRKLIKAEAARDRGDRAAANEITDAVVAEAHALYPPLEAEARYIGATTESMLGDNAKAQAALRETAALSEKVHLDYIAANVWIQLAQTSTFDAGDPQRGLEYVGYAASAADRLNNPPDVMAMLEYTRGTTLVEAKRGAEAEVALRKAIAIAKVSAPEIMGQAVQGLGYYYESAGRNFDAIKEYRDAIALLDAQHQVPNVEIVLRERLATVLSLVGQLDEAEREARAALTIAERLLEPDNIDRTVANVTLAQVLQEEGRFGESLAMLHAATTVLREREGTANERYAEILVSEANVLTDMGRARAAAPLYTRACATLAASLGEDSVAYAECWLNAVDAFIATGQRDAVLAALTTGVGILEKGYGPDHVQSATIRMERARLIAPTDRKQAIADMERGLAVLEKAEISSGFAAVARYGFAEVLYPVDRARAITLATAALEGFATATPRWQRSAAELKAWMATHH